MKSGFSMVSQSMAKFVSEFPDVTVGYAFKRRNRCTGFAFLIQSAKYVGDASAVFDRGSLGFSWLSLPLEGRVPGGLKVGFGRFRRFRREVPPGHTS